MMLKKGGHVEDFLLVILNKRSDLCEVVDIYSHYAHEIFKQFA